MRKFNHIAISKIVEMIVVGTLSGTVIAGFVGFVYFAVTRGIV